MDTNDSEKILKRLDSLHPKVIDLSLKRVIYLLDKLGNPQKKIPPVIHIAGTNGKGSTLAFIKAGLEASGKTVHSYTSPHLCRINERIKLRGMEINDHELVKYLLDCEKNNKRNRITIFEITTCAAFLAFSLKPADYTLLEVGLGGRLDATNVIKRPSISVITPVSMDHQQFLGYQLEEIAREKAGILKPNAPAIIGKQPDIVHEVISEKAKAVGVELSVFGKDWLSKKHRQTLIYQDHDEEIIFPVPELIGDHQVENAGIAINVLKKLNVRQNFIDKALIEVEWPARLQKLKAGPYISMTENLSYDVELWIDGGHNRAAAKAISKFLQAHFDGTIHLIMGMINSKDLEGFLLEINKVPSSITAITIPDEESSFTAEKIYSEAKKVNPNSFKAQSLKDAIQRLLDRNIDNTKLRILICGSLYLSGQILHHHN